MIESALVYIHATSPTKRFVGCGTLVEGGYVATCRHVWRQATEGAAGAAPEVEFPRARDAGSTIHRPLTLVDACETDEPPPDLVLLKPVGGVPSGTLPAPLATREHFETGPGASQTRVIRQTRWVEATVACTIGITLDPEGRRQLTGEIRQGYWFVGGSSGSPVFRDGGEQLAAILTRSEVGANDADSPLQEAFGIPATTIRRHLARVATAPLEARDQLDPHTLRRVLESNGFGDVPPPRYPGSAGNVHQGGTRPRGGIEAG